MIRAGEVVSGASVKFMAGEAKLWGSAGVTGRKFTMVYQEQVMEEFRGVVGMMPRLVTRGKKGEITEDREFQGDPVLNMHLTSMA